MKGKYDKYTLDNIVKYYKYEPFSTLERLEDYIREYPMDCVAYVHYVKVLTDIGRFEEALQFLDFIDSNFKDKDMLVWVYFKIRVLTLIHRYEEAKWFYDKYKKSLLKKEPKNEVFEVVYCAKTGLPINDKWRNRYLYNQIIDYDYDAFLKHIQKHTADYNLDAETPNKVVFNPDFPLDEVLEEIKGYLLCNKRTYVSFYNDFYTFKYDNNGKIDNKAVDYFRVITVHDTLDIITMYPLESGKNLPYIDLNYLKEEKDIKVKRLSRVERFNKKYGDFIK